MGTVDDGSSREPEPATRMGLPQHAHARRASHQELERARATGDAPAPNVSMQIATATLREEEVETSRQMIAIGRTIGLAALLPLPFIGGSVALRIAMVVSVLAAIALGAVIDLQIRRRGTASERALVVTALASSPAILIAVLYFGVMSAAQLFPALALYFFSRREQQGAALVLYLANAIIQAAIAALIVGGVIEDPGLFVPEIPTLTAIAGHALIQISFFGAFLLGRGSHRASADAIFKMQRALGLAAQREALLQEARAELDRALAIEAAGPFTGQIIGSFRIGNVIGRGGMGDVYEATHVTSGEPAAVKMLGRRDLANPQSVERFARELQAIGSLRSRHVVRVLETSSANRAGEDIPYLAMERLRGHDLALHLRDGTMPASAVLEMLEHVGDAVEEAWAKGIVHRDLKPQNLFWADAKPPIWKVLDFGIAALHDTSGTLTQGLVVGTPTYMAPEQARGERVDHRADIYSLGAIVYRCVTGQPLWSSQDVHQALYHAVHVMPKRPSALAEAALPEDVDLVLALALSKQPADRFDSCRELRAALATAFAGTLDEALRRRARDLIADHPWGGVRMQPTERTLAIG